MPKYSVLILTAILALFDVTASVAADDGEKASHPMLRKLHDAALDATTAVIDAIKPNKNDNKSHPMMRKLPGNRGGGGGGVQCGNTRCNGKRSDCCNASCGICVEPGNFCTMQVCDESI